MSRRQNRIRLGIAGYGKAGRRHAAAAALSDHVELVGIADSAEPVRIHYDGAAPLFASLGELLEQRPDAVVIALPHALLAEATLAVCAAGCHALLEKPVATRLDDVRRIADAARAAGVQLMVNFNHRFRREYELAKKLLEGGEIGTPSLLSAQMFAGAGPLPAWTWLAEAAGGGMMLYNGVHAVDHLTWLAGAPVERVSATLATHHYPNPDGLEDTVAACLRFAGGAVGTVVQLKSDTPTTLPRWDTLVYGTEGAVRIRSGFGLHWNSPRGEHRLETGEGDRFLAALDAFATALLDDRPVPIGIADGFHALDCVLTMYRAAREGRELAPSGGGPELGGDGPAPPG